MPTALTMLNSMASSDFEHALQIHREWGLHYLDLRDAIYGSWVADLDVATARRAAAAIDDAGLEVHCLSTSTFHADVALGEKHFRDEHLARLERILKVARPLQPSIVRVLGSQLPERRPGENSVGLLRTRYPWYIDVVREGLLMIHNAGFLATIENEARQCFLSETDEFLDFFEWLDLPEVAHLTWDIQNQWATGVPPSLDTYRRLRPLIHYVHLKGGQPDPNTGALSWNCALEDAGWPVLEIVGEVVADGSSPVICLNPAQHGNDIPGYDYTSVPERDVRYLRANVEGIL